MTCRMAARQVHSRVHRCDQAILQQSWRMLHRVPCHSYVQRRQQRIRLSGTGLPLGCQTACHSALSVCQLHHCVQRQRKQRQPTPSHNLLDRRQASACTMPGAPMIWWCPLAAGTMEGYLCVTCIAVLPMQNTAKEMLCVAPAAWEAAALPPADVVCRALPIQRCVLPGLWRRPHQRARPLQPSLLCRPLQPHVRCSSASGVSTRN